MKVGAQMAFAWGAILALLINMDMLNAIRVDRLLHAVLLIGSFLCIAVAFPAYRDPTLRNPRSVMYLIVGAVLIGAVAAVLTFAFVIWLLSGWNFGSHN